MTTVTYCDPSGYAHDKNQDSVGNASGKNKGTTASESGRPNTLEEHTRIAREALKAGGVSDSMIDDLINASLKNLSEQGITAPTRIPWYSK